MTELAIVTGADSSHFGPLRNLLMSLELFEPSTRVVVWDLGLTGDERHALEGHELRLFPFGAHPPHVAMAARSYAWKPIALAEILHELGGAVLWLDAGDLVHARLHRVRALLAGEGFWSPASSGTIRRWTHPQTLAALGAGPELLDRRNRNGAIVGATLRAAALVDAWRAAALDPSVITPPGSSRENHRQDQAVLSVLAYQWQPRLGYALEDSRLEVSVHNDRLSPEEARGLLGCR